MAYTGKFRVETRLIQILGAQYHSTEEALKELVANSWDADATQVHITLPEPLTTDPIVVTDNGYGMTPREIEAQYLRVAYDRREAIGPVTPRGRQVRGHRGIGKFAGLETADQMVLTTTSRGTRSRMRLSRAELESGSADLGDTAIPIETDENVDGAGTTIELFQQRQRFAFPDAVKLGRLLLREFGRQDDFAIHINGELLTAEVVEGQRHDVSLSLPNGTAVTGAAWLLEKNRSVADPGIIIRVRGRAIGSPTFFGLENDREIPKSLLHRVYGEIHADSLEEDVIASWGAFVENSIGHQALMEAGRDWVRTQLLQLQQAETGPASEAFIESYEAQIERLPVPRRELARKALMRIFRQFYDEAPERRQAIAELVLNAFEMDEYWILVQRIDETPHDDLRTLADVLRQWGLNEVAGIVSRAQLRLKALEAFEALARDSETKELSGVHQSMEQNLWILGDEYELVKSNGTLRRTIEEVFGHGYQGSRGRERPDLILAGLREKHMLVELKRPAHMLTRQDVAQAETYRDELAKHLPNAQWTIAILGGTVEAALVRDDHPGVFVSTFLEVLEQARARLDWLLDHLSTEFQTVSNG